jgi:hypothetical protein
MAELNQIVAGELDPTEGKSFALFAESNAGAWPRTVDTVVAHRLYGLGTISKVLQRQNHPPLVTVRFERESGLFNPDSFKEGFFSNVRVCDPLSSEYAKWIAEAPARAAARELFEEQERRAAAERRALERAREQQESSAIEEKRKEEELWKNWVANLRQQLRQLSNTHTEITCALQLLSDKDKQLCLVWAGRWLGDSPATERQWSQFVRDDKNEALRLLSARTAENAVIAHFSKLRQTTDVSIHQISGASSSWMSHDIEIDGEPIDIKNARLSFSSPNSYVEHTIPAFKKTRSSSQQVKILGIVSEYVTWKRIQEGDLGSATILGLLSQKELVDLDVWMSGQFGDILEFDLCSGTKPMTYAGWLFEYPDDWYTSKVESQENIRRLLDECPNRNLAIGSVSGYLLELFGHGLAESEGRASKEDALLRALIQVTQELGLSRRSLFAWMLGTMLRALTTGGRDAALEVVTALRKILYVPHVDWSPYYPAGLYDPFCYIRNLIDMFDEIAAEIEPDLLRSMRFFRLASPTILRGLLNDSTTWQTVYAHCGGWRSVPVTAPCGNNPIHLGNSKICPECHFLICGVCAHCMRSCALCEPRQLQLTGRQAIDDTPLM